MGSWRECETLGERLKWVRERRLGLSSTHDVQAYLRKLPEARRPEAASYQSVNRYESGKRIPRVDYVLALSSEGEVDILWLLTGEGTPEPKAEDADKRLHLIRRLVDPRLRDEDLHEILSWAARVKPGGKGSEGVG